MKSPLKLICGGLLAFAIISMAQSRPCQAQVSGIRVPTLEERLIFGLKARAVEERTFLRQVATMTNNGAIPAEMTDKAFFWTRSRLPNHRYPFIYFERILRLLGEEKNVFIPPYTGPFR